MVKQAKKTKKKAKKDESKITKTEKEIEVIDEQIDQAKSNRIFFYSIIAVVLIIVLLFSIPKLIPTHEIKTIDDVLQETVEGTESETQFSYNGYAFALLDGLWYTQVQAGNKQYTVPLHFSPKDVEDVPVKGYMDAFMTFMRNNPIEGISPAAYITFEPTGPDQKYVALANGEFAIPMVKTINMRPYPACTINETEGCANVPAITCENSDVPVVFFDHSGEAGVIFSQNCLTLKGYGMELTKSVDRFLYALFGVMPAS